jgi:hypothetical protein
VYTVYCCVELDVILDLVVGISLRTQRLFDTDYIRVSPIDVRNRACLMSRHTPTHVCGRRYLCSGININIQIGVITYSTGGRDRVGLVCIATGYGVEGFDDRTPVGVRDFSVSHTRPDRPWYPPSLLYNGYWVISGGKAAGAWR